MSLTIDYNLLSPEKRKFPNSENLESPDLYHYALFSDNNLVASVVVNSTIMNVKVSAIWYSILKCIIEWPDYIVIQQFWFCYKFAGAWKTCISSGYWQVELWSYEHVVFAESTWGCNNPCWKCWRKSTISRMIVQKHSLLVPLIWSIEA